MDWKHWNELEWKWKEPTRNNGMKGPEIRQQEPTATAATNHYLYKPSEESNTRCITHYPEITVDQQGHKINCPTMNPKTASTSPLHVRGPMIPANRKARGSENKWINTYWRSGRPNSWHWSRPTWPGRLCRSDLIRKSDQQLYGFKG